MKHRIVTLCFTLLLCLALCVPVFAESGLDYITDEISLLSQEEYSNLYSKAEEISEKNEFPFYLMILDDYTDYYGDTDIESAVRSIYHEYDLGIGEESDGILLMLSMSQRKYGIYTKGYGNTAFTDYGKEYLADAFKDDFGDDEWYNGFSDYLDRGDEMLQLAYDGNPVDEGNVPLSLGNRIIGIVICVLLGFLIAFMVKVTLMGQLKSVAKGTEADDFVAKGGLKLTRRDDRYTNTTRSRVYDPPHESSSSGGGTSVDSSGGSSSSGSF